MKNMLAFATATMSATFLNPWPGHGLGLGVWMIAAIVFIVSLVVLFND